MPDLSAACARGHHCRATVTDTAQVRRAALSPLAGMNGRAVRLFR